MKRETYHHGDLRRALIDATAALIEQEGPAGFGLRKVARRAGVSPAAPSHHFGDTRGLLTALATEGFQRLLVSFETIDPDLDPHRRLVELARCYVDLAIRAPGHMAVMFRDDLIDTSDPAYLEAAPRTYDEVAAAVTDALGDDGAADVDCATKTLWSTCHGLAHLYPTTARSLDDDPTLDHLVDHAASIVYLGMRAVPGDGTA